jgi:hypothetical protein
VFRAIHFEPAGEDWRLIRQRELSRALLHENFIGTSGVVIRKDLAMALDGFDESIAFGEDSDFWFRLAHRSDALYSPRVGHSYRVHSASLVQSNPPIRNALSRIQVLRRERARWPDRAAQRPLKVRIARNLDIIAYQQRRQRQRWRALRSSVHAFAMAPRRHRLLEIAKAAFLTPNEERHSHE